MNDFAKNGRSFLSSPAIYFVGSIIAGWQGTIIISQTLTALTCKPRLTVCHSVTAEGGFHDK